MVRSTCAVCLEAYGSLDHLGLVDEGWAHIECVGYVTVVVIREEFTC